MKKTWIVCFFLIVMVPCAAFASDPMARMGEIRVDTDTDIMGARLGPALYALASRADLDIIVNPKLDGTVIARLTGKTVLEAFELLSRANNFNWIVEGNTIIATPGDIGSQTKSFPVPHGDLEYASKQLQTFVPINKIAVNPEYGTISVNGTPMTLALVEKKLGEFIKPITQVHIQAQFVEVSKGASNTMGLGFAWGTYSGSWPPVYAVTLNADGLRGKGKMLSRPSLTTFNGREAKISMGDKVPVFSTNTVSGGTASTAVEYKDIGMFLTVTPRVNESLESDEKMITLKLKPSVSAITKWIQSGTNKAPQIATRDAETMVRVASGSTIIIGGLMREEELQNLIGIPGLMDLPILGALFRTTVKSKEKTEIFILVTPTILDNNGKPIKAAAVVAASQETPAAAPVTAPPVQPSIEKPAPAETSTPPEKKDDPA